MSNTKRTRHRPRRGIMPGTEGGLGGLPGPDKAEAGADEPVGRQLGLDSRDIPGGLPHLVNPESPPSKPAVKEPRPLFTGMNAHGVPDPDPELGYTDTPTDVRPGPRSEPVPKWHDAVPVYQVEGPVASAKRKRVSACDGPITAPLSTAADPVRLCGSDPYRVQIQILNESTVIDVRVGTRSDVLEGRGALISHFTNTYLRLASQDELFAMSASSSTTAAVSVILETEIPDINNQGG